jgi:predicted RNA-binding protein associated with RNAse of E/G family
MLCGQRMNKTEVIIIKNDHKGLEAWRYSGQIIAESPKGIIAEAYFNRSDLEFNGILLKKGDRFLELYLYGKWFNIFEIYDRDSGLLKAWYCNITRPVRVSNNFIYYDDLALDLLVYPDRCQLPVDEDEFTNLELNKTEKQNALSAMKELQTIFFTTEKVDVFNLL